MTKKKLNKIKHKFTCKSNKKCNCYKKYTSTRRYNKLRKYVYFDKKEFSKRRILPDKLNDDKTIVNKAIDADKYYFFSASKRLKDDKELALKALDKDENVFYELSNRLQNDEDVVKKAIEENQYVFNFIKPELKKNENVLNTIQLFLLKELDFKQTINDKNFYLKLFKIASHQLKKHNKKHKYYPVSYKFSFLLNASPRLKDDIDVVKHAVKLSPKSFIHASDKLKKDTRVLNALFHEPLKNNRIMNVSTQRDHFKKEDIQYLGNYDKKTAIILMKHKANLYSSLKPQFINDKDVLLEALKSQTYIRFAIMPNIPDKLKHDPDIKKVLDKGLAYFSKKYNNDKKFIMKSVKNYNTFKRASKSLRNDKEVVLKALSNPARKQRFPDELLKYTSNRLKNDKDVFLKSLQNVKRFNKTNN
jgi:hypothetical protein